MPADRVTLALLAPEGPMRDGLEALCSALPAVDVVVQAIGWDSALGWLRRSPPDLVVFDAALANAEVGAALDQLRAAAPHSARLGLVDEVPQLTSTQPSERLLLKGAPAGELAGALQVLVDRVQATLKQSSTQVGVVSHSN